MALVTETDQKLAAAEAEIVSLRGQLGENRRTHLNHLNAIWKIVYPGYPDSWDYPDQVIRHIRAFVEEREMMIADLASMLREERALRTPAAPGQSAVHRVACLLLRANGHSDTEILLMHREDRAGYEADAERLLYNHIVLTRGEYNDLLRFARTYEGRKRRMAIAVDAMLAMEVGEALEKAIDQLKEEG